MHKLQLKLNLPLFLFCCLINGNIFAQADTLKILHITDLHVIFNQAGYHPDMIGNRKLKQYDQGENRLRQFLQEVPAKTNSDMVIGTGDLVDFFEAETADIRMMDLQAEQFSRLISDYRIPVLLTLGNHDLFTFYWRDSKLTHTQNFSGRARAAWTKNFDCFKNGTYYSKLFNVDRTTYRLIFLDDSFYQFLPEDKFEVPYIDKAQLYWLNDQLKESENDVEIILMHIPLMDPASQPKYSKELYSALAKNPSTKLILSGHHHKNLVAVFPSADNNKLTQVQTGSLVQDTASWRLIRLTENNILVSFPGNTENELVIPVK